MAAANGSTNFLSAVRPFVEAGFAIHRLKVRSKRPVLENWSTAPVATMEKLERFFVPGENVGVRLGEPSKTESGFVHLIDLDIRDPEQAEHAWKVLRHLLPSVDTLPRVKSGSGGHSRHFYFFCDKPFNSRKLARSEGFTMVHDASKGREVKKFDWEIELFGTGKQAVVPPSIHPDTGLAYEWERPIDLGLVSMGIGPTIPAGTLELWGAAPEIPDDDDLLAFVRSQPIGMTKDEVEKVLKDLPREEWCDDRDGWLQAGMALHHEFAGSEDGFQVWANWSRQSDKYDEKDQRRVWKSFGESRGKPVRMPTLIKAASIARLEGAHTEVGLVAAPVQDATLAALLGEPDDLSANPLLGPPPKPDEVSNWRELLHITEEGEIKVTLHNIALIVRNDPRTRGIMAYNQFTQEVVLYGAPGEKTINRPTKPVKQLSGPIWQLRDPINGDLWADSHDHAIRDVIEAPTRQGGYGIKISDRDLKAAIDIVAHENAFHPVRRYLDSLQWDGTPRVEKLFIDYLEAEDNAFHEATALLTLVGAVARVFEPGHKFDFVPVIEGGQGRRKSTFVKTLARQESWFAELEGDFHDTKAMVEKMQGAWVLELPELQGFSRAEVTTIKGFLSRTTDKVRMAYARRAVEFPRQCVVIGTTNEEQYLRDTTGNRRFWPVPCNADTIDTDRLRANVDQIWAEAVVRYREMREGQPGGTLPLYLRGQVAQDEAQRLQEDRRVETGEEGLAGQIALWLEQPVTDSYGFEDLDENRPKKYRQVVCGLEIWTDMLGRKAAEWDSRQSQKIGYAMKQVPGWESAGRGRLERFGRQRIYRRVGCDISAYLL